MDMSICFPVFCVHAQHYSAGQDLGHKSREEGRDNLNSDDRAIALFRFSPERH